MTQPITPDDLETTYALPEWVVEVWNGLIQASWKERGDRTAVVYATKAEWALTLNTAASEASVPARDFDKRWLDIYTTYEAAGWTVTYTNDPGCFTFKRKPVRQPRGGSDE